MKKKLLLVLTIFSTLCLVGCKDHVKTGEDTMVPVPGDNWVALCYHENFGNHCTTRIYYFYDKDTEIVYMYSEGISVVYDKDGEPMTKSDFVRTHNEKYHKGN